MYVDFRLYSRWLVRSDQGQAGTDLFLFPVVNFLSWIQEANLVTMPFWIFLHDTITNPASVLFQAKVFYVVYTMT